MVMPLDEYDELYFDGGLNVHDAGYTVYERGINVDSNDPTGFAEPKNLHKTLFDRFDLNGKTVLFLGCAKGFEVDDFNLFGAIASGVDISPYAVNSHPDIIVGNIISHLQSLPDDSFDFIIGLRILPCFNVGGATQVVALSIAKAIHSYFTVDAEESYEPEEILNLDQHYNIRPLQTWINMGGPNATIEAV